MTITAPTPALNRSRTPDPSLVALLQRVVDDCDRWLPLVRFDTDERYWVHPGRRPDRRVRRLARGRPTGGGRADPVRALSALVAGDPDPAWTSSRRARGSRDCWWSRREIPGQARDDGGRLTAN